MDTGSRPRPEQAIPKGSASSLNVIIIGGGAAGLSAAYTLRKAGIQPILLEALGHVGGRSFGDQVGAFRLDAGADFFCSSYDVAFRLC